ncbi:MAG: alpha/beta fold hydrolase [Bacteroidota bacterium]
MSLFNKLAIIILFSSFTFVTGAQESSVTGFWSGKIQLPVMTLEMIFNISENDSGKLVATLDVPMQGAKDISVSEVISTQDSLILKVPQIMGIYKGRFITADSVEGQWHQSGRYLTLNLVRKEEAPVINRPQTPKPPFPYLVEEVEYINPESGFKLAGTLTIPENANGCPAVVMISGSGAQDRDETIFEHKPFWVIADYFARNGIAVLRIDDRGVGGSEGNIREATSEDFAGDVLAGIDFLKTRKEINPEKIGLTGHSEGGLIAPIAATKREDIAFIILMAGPGINGEQILYEQGELINRAGGLTESQIEQNKKMQKAIFDIILNEKDSATQIDRLQRTYSGGMYFMLDSTRKQTVDDRIRAVNTPWFKFFLTYDPYPTLTKVSCPVLTMIGEKDLQVPPKSNLAAIEKALTEGGNKNVKTMELPGLNHLFQNCKTGTISEYAEIEETIDVKVLEIMKNWIIEVAR